MTKARVRDSIYEVEVRSAEDVIVSYLSRQARRYRRVHVYVPEELKDALMIVHRLKEKGVDADFFIGSIDIVGDKQDAS